MLLCLAELKRKMEDLHPNQWPVSLETLLYGKLGQAILLIYIYIYMKQGLRGQEIISSLSEGVFIQYHIWAYHIITVSVFLYKSL